MRFVHGGLGRRRRDRLDQRVLAAVRAGEPFGWELSRRLRVSPSRVQASLDRLESAGSIRSEPFRRHVDVPPRRAYFATDVES